MKNTSRKPYIYKVTNFVTGPYYIGSQCSGKILGMNYFTSSTNKKFKEDFKAHKEEKYKIEIIKEFEDPEECVRAENYIIRNHMLKKDGLCLNRSYCCNGEKIFSTVGIHHSEETRKKMSRALKGRPAWNKGIPSSKKGIPRSEETKQKISLASKGHPSWNKGIPSPHKGIPQSEETRKKISIALKRKISIKNTVFDSLTEVAKYYNVVPSTIRYWIKKNQHNAVYIEKCPKI